MSEIETREALISQFLAKCLIGEDRVKTRSAIIRCLSLLPDSVLVEIVRTPRIIIAAPESYLFAGVIPLAIVQHKVDWTEQRFMLVFFDGRLEADSEDAVFRAVSKSFEYSFAKLSGLDETRATQIATQLEDMPTGGSPN